MKKALMFFTVLTVITGLFGCSYQKNILGVLSVPCELRAVELSTETEFLLKASSEGFECEILAPQAVSGTKLKYDGVCTVTVGDFERECEREDFASVCSLEKAIRLLNENRDSITFTATYCQYTIDGMTVLVYYEEKGKAVASIITQENGKQFEYRINNEAQS